MLREHHKALNTQKRFEDKQLKAAQQSAGAQIDARCDLNLAGIDVKVKSIIKETVKRQSIKIEALGNDISDLTCDMSCVVHDNFNQVNLIPVQS